MLVVGMPFDPEIPRTSLPLTSASFSHWTRRGFSSGVHRGRILPWYKDRSASFPRISFRCRRRFARTLSLSSLTALAAIMILQSIVGVIWTSA